MRRERCNIAIMLAVLLVCPIGSSAQVSGSHVRHVRERPGTALSALVKPGDETLIVDSVQDPVQEVLPGPGVSDVYSKAQTSVVLVVEVLTVDAEVTPAQDWVKSRVTASVLDVVKTSSGWTSKSGDLVTFEQDGGEVYVGGTRVVASLPWTRSVQAAKRYLMFVKPISGTDVIASPSGIYEIIDTEVLRRLAPSPGGPDDVEKTGQSEVLQRIRDAVR
jgi:hypothetical protein